MPLPAADEVHLWALDLARSPGTAADLVAAEDLRRAERAGPRWLLARAGLRALLGGYLDEDPASLRFDESGKPRLAEDTPLRFNLSHSGDVALVVVAAGREVGVDVEEVKPRRFEALAARSMLAAERAAIGEAADGNLAFHRHWVAKEAAVKATGRGISSLRSLEVALDGPGGPRLVHVGGDRRAAARWRLHMLDVAAPYVAALVTEGDVRVAPLAVFEP